MKHLFLTLAFLNSCVCTANEVERMPLDTTDEALSDQEIAYAKEMANSVTPQPMLYGGKPVEPGELPMSFNVGFCSVAVVGPQVFHSASHCHSTGSTASFMYKGIKRTGVCTRHPQYNDNTVQNDWALCKFSPAIEDKDFIYASLKETKLDVGSVVILSGYGRGSTGGKLHWGKLPIVRVTNQEYITQDSRLYLGSGDSGNMLLQDQPDLKKGPFNLVGVNSRAGSGMSIFNYTAHPNAQSFYKSYAANNGVEICGITKDCQAGGEEPPPPPPDLPGYCGIEKRLFDLAVNRMEFFRGKMIACGK